MARGSASHASPAFRFAGDTVVRHASSARIWRGIVPLFTTVVLCGAWMRYQAADPRCGDAAKIVCVSCLFSLRIPFFAVWWWQVKEMKHETPHSLHAVRRDVYRRSVCRPVVRSGGDAMTKPRKTDWLLVAALAAIAAFSAWILISVLMKVLQ